MKSNKTMHVLFLGNCVACCLGPLESQATEVFNLLMAHVEEWEPLGQPDAGLFKRVLLSSFPGQNLAESSSCSCVFCSHLPVTSTRHR